MAVHKDLLEVAAVVVDFQVAVEVAVAVVAGNI
jgi:hypothetical protein